MCKNSHPCGVGWPPAVVFLHKNTSRNSLAPCAEKLQFRHLEASSEHPWGILGASLGHLGASGSHLRPRRHPDVPRKDMEGPRGDLRLKRLIVCCNVQHIWKQKRQFRLHETSMISTVYCNLQQKRIDDRAADVSRPLYQHRKNPYNVSTVWGKTVGGQPTPHGMPFLHMVSPEFVEGCFPRKQTKKKKKSRRPTHNARKAMCLHIMSPQL